MGGSAFSAILSAASFPRLPPPVYQALKSSLLPKLRELYVHTAVAPEAPEKVDHGDLDLLVAIPKGSFGPSIPHEIIRKAIGATHANEMEDNRTSNYAVPIKHGEWSSMGHTEDEEQSRLANNNDPVYYQIDVRVCLDKAEWDRVLFFHSYGDMGMILGLVARNGGIALGEKGLKIPGNPPYELSESFDKILPFFGLSLETFSRGFSTKQELFEWVASSKYFDPSYFQTEGQGFTKVKAERKMYAEFVQWVQRMNHTEETRHNRLLRETRRERIRAEALLFFEKKEEYDTLIKVRSGRAKLKESFSGSRVRDWTELGEYWKGVKLIMDETRKRLGGEEGVLNYLEENGEDGLKRIVLQVKDDLGLRSMQRRPEDVAPKDSNFDIEYPSA